MVEVTGAVRGMSADVARLRCTANDGWLPFEDGRRVPREGLRALRAAGDQFQLGGSRIVEVSDLPEAIDIVLSMPKGTGAAFFLQAACALAKTEPTNYRCVMVLHTHLASWHEHLAVRSELQRWHAPEPTQVRPAWPERDHCRARRR